MAGAADTRLLMTARHASEVGAELRPASRLPRKPVQTKKGSSESTDSPARALAVRQERESLRATMEP